MNLAILVGTISSEIRRIDLQQGGSVTKFRLKTIEVLQIDGEIRERSQTHLIDIWSSYLQEKIVPDLREGQIIEVQGSIESRNVAKSGEPDRWTTTIVIRNKGHITQFAGQSSIRADASDSERELNIDHRKSKPPEAVTEEENGLPYHAPF